MHGKGMTLLLSLTVRAVILHQTRFRLSEGGLHLDRRDKGAPSRRGGGQGVDEWAARHPVLMSPSGRRRAGGDASVLATGSRSGRGG